MCGSSARSGSAYRLDAIALGAADVVIANGVECEPVLAKDKAIMRARPGDVAQGLVMMMECVGASRGIIAVKRKNSREVDAMLKAANVQLHAAKPVCPGKYAILVYGGVADVQSSVEAGVEAGGQFVVDQLVIANIHPSVWPAVTGVLPPPEIRALGIIETYSIASTVLAADAAVKAAGVSLVEVRLALGLGGKAFATVLAGDRGVLTEAVVIPAPAEGLAEFTI